MEVTQIVESLNTEIELLTQVRNLLTGHHTATSFGYGVNRVAPKRKYKKRTISAEGRARIAAAQKARWAKQKRAAKKAA